MGVLDDWGEVTVEVTTAAVPSAVTVSDATVMGPTSEVGVEFTTTLLSSPAGLQMTEVEVEVTTSLTSLGPGIADSLPKEVKIQFSPSPPPLQGGGITAACQ
jgi:hypothetical protein